MLYIARPVALTGLSKMSGLANLGLMVAQPLQVQVMRLHVHLHAQHFQISI